MFDIDIKVAALQGVELHERDGTLYWKLLKICSACGGELGECLCFTEKEQMERARDENYYCSAECWFGAISPEKKVTELAEFREQWAGDHTDLEPDDLENYPDDTDPLFLEQFYAWTEEWWCEVGECMAEAVGADMECPI